MQAEDVAAAIIRHCNRIDALKLQKLLFISAGEYLAMTGETMFEEPLEAWEYGPVVYVVYRRYRDHEADPIPGPSGGDEEALNELARACVESVVTRFGDLSGPDLIRLTHRMAPWQKAYNPGTYRTKIDDQAMYDYFAKPPTDAQVGEGLAAWEKLIRSATDEHGHNVRFVIAS